MNAFCITFSYDYAFHDSSVNWILFLFAFCSGRKSVVLSLRGVLHPRGARVFPVVHQKRACEKGRIHPQSYARLCLYCLRGHDVTRDDKKKRRLERWGEVISSWNCCKSTEILGKFGKCFKQSRQGYRSRGSLSSSTSIPTKYGRSAL